MPQCFRLVINSAPGWAGFSAVFSMSATDRALLICLALGMAGLATIQAVAADVSNLYRATSLVTGTGEINRQRGFSLCMDQVIVRVTGDLSLLSMPQVARLRDRAGELVGSFTYRDRLEGIPIHDEQGSRDRPYDLTCNFDQEKLDAALTELGARPWLAPRPVVVPLLAVEHGHKHFVLVADGEDGRFMDVSFAAAAEPLAMRIALPVKADISTLDGASPWLADQLVLNRMAQAGGGDVPLLGRLTWSDADLGWVADWRMTFEGNTHDWQVRGVSFDEAFRVAMRGAAQILSGNGRQLEQSAK